MVSSPKSSRRTKASGALAQLAVACALSTATLACAASPGLGSWWKRQDPTAATNQDPSVLKLISATGPYATLVPGSGNGNADAIQSAVGMSGDIPSQAFSALAPAETAATPTDGAADAVMQAVEATVSPTASAASKVASESLDRSQESQMHSEPSAEPTGEGEVSSWTISAPSSTPSIDPAEALAESVLSNAASDSDFSFAFLAPASAVPPATPTPTIPLHRRQYPIQTEDRESNLFPLFTSYLTLQPPSTTIVNFGPTPNLNMSSIPRRAPGTGSGNGEAPSDINNPNSPDVGWLDLQVGAVPYKNGDLIASIVWVLATIALIPLLLIRLLRRSSLISMVLLTVIVYMVLMLVAFGVRARLSATTPTTSLMNVEGIILAVLVPLLIEPLLHLLGLYSQQSGRSTGVPQAALILRILNLIVFLLFLVAAAYYASWLDSRNKALQMTQTAQDLPGITPPKVTRIGPVVASVLVIIVILGAALLIPIARGDSGSMRPGGFFFVLLLLLFISTVWRLLQTLHATTRISAELGGELDSNNLLPFFKGGSSNSTTDNQRVAQGLSLAPQGMYGPRTEGIAWEQLQVTMASRSAPQTPLIFNLVYVLPMWLMVFLLFFAHAPVKKDGEVAAEGGDKAVAVAEV
ncbi:hypothetical protein NDA11_007391 [Ustilago hordei]|uniref:Uncharacterized protein n=1 Tax=Ustilago hordei TaxID=120017 RepID=I2G0Y6_USTHO|nr:uncharacterized protein UHO2_03261 [Ustilago hordei]KAJ1041087.1 hypothetical protein NDA10_007659 [Ustilago hordei]KAJ1588842.1 hypothetical protein NDA11_007391 [Ustilago hordei]KAJ1599814.1 hypothetical protein NDA14_002880 [Ustilago hordei]UTT92450.1 hypothetical protein NDA17_007669 [Ustilago hordei]CCF52829.1 uncharacterized protein UHOR_04175 [Ustilago hordei]